jgi:hypothetical protein
MFRSSMNRHLLLVPVLLLVAMAAGAADAPLRTPHKDYTLELVLTPVGDSKVIGRLGSVAVTVYPQGIHADSMWLDAISRQDSPNIVMFNPTTRLFSPVPVDGFRSVVLKMTGASEELMPKLRRFPIEDPVRARVGDIPASRYRIRLGPESWIDVWTTDIIPENPQLRRVSEELLSAISKEVSYLAREIPGVPLAIQFNTKNYPGKTVLSTKALRRSSAGHEQSLALGSFYVRTPLAERLWR